MTNEEYQLATAKFAVYPDDKAEGYLIAGLASEAGEVAGKYKKGLRGDYAGRVGEYEYDIIAELGDCFWYLSELCSHYGVSINAVMEHNIKKLADRAGRDKLKGSGDTR